ncbi:hypothetical protein Glove_155g73 [Diversispora epigaea]|uniref:Protein kinase domain-containing protein n=1 Tax=Diversispora epigaea TaxID=1348612 RepID=A0A397J164_9GLOM|nr:hypothetical protein Glove_155g73 [Diversispora epigaea]
MENCLEGHSSEDFAYSGYKNLIYPWGRCSLCTKEHFIQEFKTWSSGNVDIDKIIQESQINNKCDKLHWISYDNFQNIKHIADGGHGSVNSAKLEDGIKWDWNFVKQEWEYHLIGDTVALKEIKDSRFDMVGFLRGVNPEVGYFGISKNPSTQNYIIVRMLFDDDVHNFLTKNFWDLRWRSKLDLLFSIISRLENLHEINLVHCNLHSANILIMIYFYPNDRTEIDPSSCKLENDLILNANDKNNKIYGLIPYIPPEVLRGNEFTEKGDIYSFGGIMYEIVTAQRPFADQAHDIYLMIDICNGVRPKVPDFMLNWIPEWYLDLMYRCWSDDSSERPTAAELGDLFCDALHDTVDNNVTSQLQIADENQKNTSKSQKQELFELFSYSNKLHPQSWYIGRYIHTLHGLRDLLEEIKSGKSSVKPIYGYRKFKVKRKSDHSLIFQPWIGLDSKNSKKTPDAIENNISTFDGHPKSKKVFVKNYISHGACRKCYLFVIYNCIEDCINVGDEETCNDIREFICVEEEMVSCRFHQWYLNLMHRRWSNDPSKRPTAISLTIYFVKYRKSF